MKLTTEHERLEAYRQRKANWKKWGPYLSERSWGTVREDYSADGNAWNYFPHDHARSRAFRWGEDGIAGVCDRNQYICFALALWNGRDPILKERMFGLTGSEGNHGEDVKEYYFYLDSTPTHSFMKMLYKYPQSAFPYAELVAENRKRSHHDFEYELLDTGVFADNRYFDVQIEYAKADPDDILGRITVVNRGPDPSACHVLPTLWFRNTWRRHTSHLRRAASSADRSILAGLDPLQRIFSRRQRRRAGRRPSGRLDGSGRQTDSAVGLFAGGCLEAVMQREGVRSSIVAEPPFQGAAARQGHEAFPVALPVLEPADVFVPGTPLPNHETGCI